MQLAPGQAYLDTVVLDQLLSCAKRPRPVMFNSVHGFGAGCRAWRGSFSISACCLRHGEIRPEQAHDEADQAFNLM